MKKGIKVTLSILLSCGLFTIVMAGGLDELPSDIRDSVYNPKLMDPAHPRGESALREWKSERKPPWTVGYASTYAGNTWRKGAMGRLMDVI